MSGRASAVAYNPPKMETDLSPRKTLLVLVIVVGCFAILWPKVFYPMLVGSANQYIKPSPIDKAAGCCDVISENDVNTIKLMSELCGSIINATAEDKPLRGKEIVQKCRQEVLETCGIDISVVLQEQVRLGQNVKQILNEVRSMNGSLCLKYNYGVAPWRLGVPHRVTVRSSSDSPNIRQERPHHLRSELIHPAFRERGRAIPQPQSAPIARPSPRVVEGRPGPLPGMKPILGGAGHVVPPSKQGTSSMSVIMPIYTIGIVIFFTYTLMKILFRKQPEGVGGDLYPAVESDPNFRKEVFESESSRLGPRLTRETIASKLVVNAISALLDEVDQEIEARRKGSEVVSQDLVNGTLSNGDAVKPQDEDQPTVTVLGMETTTSCEGGKKWTRPDSPLPPPPSPPRAEPVPPPQEIYLEGALPAQSQLLVSESATEPEPSIGEDPAVILSGKMTLSVISVDSETGVEEIIETIEGEIPTVRESSPQIKEIQSPLEKEIADFLSNLRDISDIQTPVITFDNEETSQNVKVDEVEKEVDELIQEAIENIESRDLTEVTDISEEITNALDESEAESLQSLPVAATQAKRVSFDLSGTDFEDDEQIGSEAGDDVAETEPVSEDQAAVVGEKTGDEGLESSLVENIKAEIDALLLAENVAAKILDEDDWRDEVKTEILSENKTGLTAVTKEEIIEESKETEQLQSTVDFKDEIKIELDDVAIPNVVKEKKEAEQLQSTVEDFKEEIKNELDDVAILNENVAAPVTEENRDDGQLQSTVEDFKEEIKNELDLIDDALNKNEIHEQGVIAERVEELKEEIKSEMDEKKSPASAIVDTEHEISDKLKEETKTEKNSETVEQARIEQIKEVPDENEKHTEQEKPSNPVEEEYSDDDLIDEIEEIEYEEETEEELEVEEEEEESEEIPINTNPTVSSSAGRVNGERSEDPIEESKYTTVSGTTAAENDISDADDEELTDDEEIIEIEEEIDEDDYEVEEGNDVNHIAGDSEEI